MTATTHIETGPGGTPVFRAIDGEHDDAVTLSFRGVTVTITLRSDEFAQSSDTSRDTVLVFVDRDDVLPIAVYVDDAEAFEHQPIERVAL
jgi:hypothetical protein